MSTLSTLLEEELIKISRNFNYNPSNLTLLTNSQLLILASNLHEEDKLDPYVSREARSIFLDRLNNLSPLKGLDLKRSIPNYTLLVPTIKNRFDPIASTSSSSSKLLRGISIDTPSDTSIDSFESSQNQNQRTASTSLASRISPPTNEPYYSSSPNYSPLSSPPSPTNEIPILNLSISSPDPILSNIPYTRQNLYDTIILSDENRSKNTHDLKELVGDLNFAKKLEIDWDWVYFAEEVDFLDRALKILGDSFEIRSLIPAFPPKWAKNYIRYEPLFLPDLPPLPPIQSSFSRDHRPSNSASGKSLKTEGVFLEAQLETLRYLYRNVYPQPIINESTLSYVQGTSFGQYLFHLGEVRRLIWTVKGRDYNNKGLWGVAITRSSKIEQERWNSKMRKTYQALIKGYDNLARRKLIVKDFILKGYIA